jgi:two-component system chemotaxis response regulator CheB
MPALLRKLVNQSPGEALSVPESVKFEVQVARTGRSSMNDMDRIGRRSVLTCPDCNGVLWEIEEDDTVHFRCHVGHAYTGPKMALAVDEELQRALGSALRALEERIALAERLSSTAAERGQNQVTAHWTRRKQEYEEEATVIRRAIVRADEVTVSTNPQ